MRRKKWIPILTGNTTVRSLARSVGWPAYRGVVWLLALAGALLAWSNAATLPPAYAADPGCSYLVPTTIEKIDGTQEYAHIQPGDTLCLSAGTRGNLKIMNLHGTPDKPITIRNTGGTVIITGTQFLSGGIGVVGSSYLRITGSGVKSKCGAEYAPSEQECGLEIGPAHKGMKIVTNKGTPHGIEIDHVYIHDTSTVTRTRGIAIHPIEEQLISGVYVHHNYIRNTTAEGIYIGTEPHDRPFEILGKLENVEVSHNLIEQIEYDGIKIKVAVNNVKVHHNVIRKVGLARVPAHQSGIKLAFSVGEYYNNLIETDIEGIVMGRTLDNPGTKYYNNIIVGAKVVCLEAREDDALVYNNTVVNCGAAGIRAPGAAPQIFDNIIADTALLPIEAGTANTFNNLSGSSSSIGFVDPAAGDYHLQLTSPAVDAGRFTGTFPTFDYNGVARPQGSKTDLGAYEYVFASRTHVPLITATK